MTQDKQLESKIIDGIFSKLVTAGVFEHNNPSEVTQKFMDEQKEINKNLLGLVTKIDKTVAIMAKDIEGIHEQTKATNGRVNGLMGWKNKITGALIVTEFILVPIAIAKLLEVLK